MATESPSVKSLLKDLSRDVTAAAAGKEDSLKELDILALIAVTALSHLENFTGSEDDNEELRRTTKRCRKQLQGYIAESVEHNKVEDQGLDLGQYSHTQVFEGDDKKTAKFARLMGGAKAKEGKAAPTSSPRLHSTYAPTHKELTKISLDVEEQFAAATTHKGKKGLGL